MAGLSRGNSLYNLSGLPSSLKLWPNYRFRFCLPMQNSPPNTNIAMIEANDEDANGNAQIVYTFPNFAARSGPFQISRTTGVVTVRSDGAEGLDRERQDVYEVSILKHGKISSVAIIGDRSHPTPISSIYSISIQRSIAACCT